MTTNNIKFLQDMTRMTKADSLQTETLAEAVSTIKTAILQSQSRAVRIVSGSQLSLYFGVGLYVSAKSREGAWGSGTIDAISQQLQRELPGLRGFSVRSIRDMRLFAEFWQQYLIWQPTAAKLEKVGKETEIDYDCLALEKWSPMAPEINRDEFLGISFSHHMEILHKTKDIHQVLFCIHEAVVHQWDKYTLRDFKPAYLGQLYAYLQILDDKVRKPHENPSIGIVLCKSANQAYCEYAVRDYNKPMGVATYKTAAEMPEAMKRALPDLDELKKIMEE